MAVHMSNEFFYNKVREEIIIDDTKLSSLLCGKKCYESGFYELCCHFAAAASNEKSPAEEIINELLSHVTRFCSHNLFQKNKALFEAVCECYSLLLPPMNTEGNEPYGSFTKEDWWRGGNVAVFNHPAGLSSEIWQGVFGDVMY